ncbi:hypothetical protein DMN50_04975 [Priestia megaterium]|nr:hypothetical protein DMN50_04975 [Priestia megaterium]
MKEEKVNNSNRNGRAFEAIIFHQLVQQLKLNRRNLSADMPKKTMERQKIDSTFFNKLYEDSIDLNNKNKTSDEKLYNSFIVTAPKIVNWMFNKFNLSNYEHLTLIKPDDNAGKLGDITDIRIEARISNKTEIINFSLKNNSSALKHSRLSGVPEWLGLDLNSSIAISYTKDLKATWDLIQEDILKYEAHHSDTIYSFSDLNKINPMYKENNLYLQNYIHVESLLNQYSNDIEKAIHLFKYLVGENYYKINNKYKLVKPKVEILEFKNIPLPNSYRVSRDNNNYIILDFDNGWQISLRLHSASTKLSASLKFDAQLKNTKKVLPQPEILT